MLVLGWFALVFPCSKFVFWEQIMYCIEESTCGFVGTFRRPPVIWCPGYSSPLGSPLVLAHSVLTILTVTTQASSRLLHLGDSATRNASPTLRSTSWISLTFNAMFEELVMKTTRKASHMMQVAYIVKPAWTKQEGNLAALFRLSTMTDQKASHFYNFQYR